MKKSELQTMVVSELKALAKKMRIRMPAGARKADIVELLAAAFRKVSRPAVEKETAIASSAAAEKETTAPSAAKSAATKKTNGATKHAVAKKKITRKPAAAPKPAVEVPPSGREWKMPPGAEEPLMAQERISDAKYYTGPEKEAVVQPYVELPIGHGEEKIALMVRDPYLAYVYWEVTPSRLERERKWFGWNGKLAVRIYDVTGVQFDGRNAVGYYDQEVKELVGNWYFDLGRPSHSFIADIGLLSPEGRYLTLARSNYIMMPGDGVSDVIDEEWMLVDEEFWKMYGFPGGPSSPQLQEMMRIRRMQQISSPGIFSRPKRK